MKKIKDLLEEIYNKWIRDCVPNISKTNALYLRNILRKTNAQHILEIWTAHGYSCLNFADEIQKNWWHIVTIEFSQIAYEIASEHIKLSGLEEYISQYFWDAREIIPLLDQNFDFIFIDGLKKASLDFFKICWDKVNIWGTVIIDDVIKFRYKMEDLYQYLDTQKIDYCVKKIDADDGIMVIKKV